MPGNKLPLLTITNKLFFRDDGLYVYSSADGQLDIIADTTAKVTAPTCELEGAITLDGNTTLDSPHLFVFNNDGVQCSSNAAATNLWDHCANISGNASGWIKVTAGSYTGYIPIFSGNLLL